VRKFLFNGSIISAFFGAIGAVQSTRKGPRDWRLVLSWVAWAASAAIAIGTVLQDAKAKENEPAA
jgi:hypothetical protein